MNPIPYGKQDISQEDIQAVVDVLQHDFITQGPTLEEFEKKFAEYCGSNYAVAVSNGTAALHLSVLALNLQAGEKILTTPLTFVASSNAALYVGAQVDFIDIDPKTYLLDLDLLEERLKKGGADKYKGIVIVSFAGYPSATKRLKEIANNYNLWIIEDACHAIGAEVISDQDCRGRVGNGNCSDLSVFSFHPVKHMTTGEGGMITTNNPKVYEKLLSLRSHGIVRSAEQLVNNSDGGWYYEMQDLGYNYRLTDIQAALGLSQLKRIENNIKRRQEIAGKYDVEFNGTNILTPFCEVGVKHAYHLYVVQVESRKEVYNYLRRKNIFTQIHYIPVHLQPFYRKLGWGEGMLPEAEAYYARCLSLPMYSSLKKEEQDYVINTLKEVCK